MIQINLLPDVKVQYIKTQRVKNTVILGSFIISGAFIVLVILMFFYVNGAQKAHTSNLQQDIDELVTALKAEPDTDKVLTVQRQLQALPDLHAVKPEVSRVDNYLSTIIPNTVSLSTMDIQFLDSALVITGSGKNIPAVNKFADTLKNATYTLKGEETSINAFSEVVLESLGSDDTGAQFSLRATFDPIIFSGDIDFDVPNITSTQSEVERPKDLFEGGN